MKATNIVFNTYANLPRISQNGDRKTMTQNSQTATMMNVGIHDDTIDQEVDWNLRLIFPPSTATLYYRMLAFITLL